MDVILPLKNRRRLRLRVVARPRQTSGRTAGVPGLGASDIPKNHS